MKYFTEKYLGFKIFSLSALVIFMLFTKSDATAAGLKPEPERKFSFRISPEEASKLELGVRRLKLNDTVERVVGILGKPSSDINFWKPRMFGSSSFVFRCLTYNVSLVEPRGGNIYDQLVLIYFDESGKLTGAELSGFSKQTETNRRNGEPAVEKVL